MYKEIWMSETIVMPWELRVIFKNLGFVRFGSVPPISGDA